MSISDRYRDIYREVVTCRDGLTDLPQEAAQAVRSVNKGAEVLSEWVEQVGEIPRMNLEHKLTPVLLKAHNHLDRGRLLFEESGLEDQAATAWGLQQKIYRLLNDL